MQNVQNCWKREGEIGVRASANSGVSCRRAVARNRRFGVIAMRLCYESFSLPTDMTMEQQMGRRM